MAKPIVDDVTAVEATSTLKFLYGDGGGDHTCLAYRIYYTGAAWAVHGSYGCINTVADIAVTWDGTNDELDVDLSGLTYEPGPTFPVIVVSASKPSGSPATANHIPQASASADTDFEIKWFNAATGAHVVAVDTQMDAQVLIYGLYV